MPKRRARSTPSRPAPSIATWTVPSPASLSVTSTSERSPAALTTRSRREKLCWRMAVEIRVLGPLEIRRGGAPVPLRAPAQRTFLAALLIDRGRVVSVDRLAEALWPEEQPRSARHALEMNATRVRRLLGDDAAVGA